MSLGVVVPAYEPRPDRLESFVESLCSVLDPEVVRIELDDPTPAAEDALTAFASRVPAVTLAVSETRRGKGAAITAGFEALDTGVLAFADADGATPASSVADVCAPVLAGRADLAVGSRRHPDAEIRSHQTRARRRMGDAFAWFARRLLAAKLYDYQCGAKAISAETWAAVRGHLYESGFAWDIELVAMAGALGHTIVEVPVIWEDQPDSTVSPIGTAIELAIALFATRHRAKLLEDDAIHAAIAARREDPTALVDRFENPREGRRR